MVLSYLQTRKNYLVYSIFGTFQCFDCDMFWICVFLVVSLD